MPAARRCWSVTCTLSDEAESFDSEGYFRTGDLGRWVDGDYLVVTGRAKDLIIRNGENIAPKEIEDILIGHPGVADIAIVGLPDARTGERACAVIVPTDEAQPDVASLRDFLQSRGVAIFKAPEQVVYLGGAAEKRRRQGAQASDSSGPDSNGRMTCK